MLFAGNSLLPHGCLRLDLLEVIINNKLRLYERLHVLRCDTRHCLLKHQTVLRNLDHRQVSLRYSRHSRFNRVPSLGEVPMPTMRCYPMGETEASHQSVIVGVSLTGHEEGGNTGRKRSNLQGQPGLQPSDQLQHLSLRDSRWGAVRFQLVVDAPHVRLDRVPGHNERPRNLQR